MRARMPSARTSAPATQVGTTLVETMIALTIGLMLLVTLGEVFVSNGGLRRDLDYSGRLVENASYAMDRISDDLRTAGYYAEFDLADAGLTMPAVKPDPCTADLNALGAALPLPIQGYDGGVGLPASCTGGAHAAIRNPKPGSDILVIRRVDPCVAGPTTAAGCDAAVAGLPYFQVSHCTWTLPHELTELAGPASGWFKLDTLVSKLGLHNIDCNQNPGAAVADYHRFVVHIYFVSNDDIPGDGIPTLKLAQLDAGGFTDASVVPLAEGIENLQLEYGLDTGTAPDGSVDQFSANPDMYAGCAGAASPCSAANWASTVAVKVHMLGRNTKATAIGYTNQKGYALGLNADGSANTIPPFNDRYRRHVYETSVRVYNSSGRNQQR
ncbi:MAG TPA: PilW family protein [Rudaea sp.]|nr:PilW family protein [Rudaea sp.]